MAYIIDIETCSKPENELQGILPEFEASKVLKDPEKIKADIDKKRQEWIDDGALHAERGVVLVVGLLNSKDRTTTLLEGSESEVIKNAWMAFMDTTGRFVGHNIKGFDIPFLMRRSWLLGIHPPSNIIRGKYLNDRFVDTMERWGCGNYRDTISLNNLAKAFGLPGKNENGKDFAGQYLLGGDFKKKALDYLKTDLLTTHAVANAMGLLH